MTVTSSYSPIGLEVPFTRGKNGYFQQTFDTNSQIKQNLLNFLKTKKGERRMFPEFGTKLYDVIFEQIDENTGRTILAIPFFSASSLYLLTIKFVKIY